MGLKKLISDKTLREYKEPTATRQAYGNFLIRFGEYEKIFVIDADLSGSLQTKQFKNKHPDRYLNLGICEGTMAGFAAGLASCGYIPFINTFAMFHSTVAYQFIFQSIAKTKMNVKIIGSHGGIHTGEDGDSHQAINDLAVMRSTPNIKVFEFSDAIQTERGLECILLDDGPAYIRLHRNKMPIIYDSSFKFEIGKGYELFAGKNIAFISSGIMTHYALKLAKLAGNCRVIDMPTIDPIDEELILKVGKENKRIVVMQDHFINGGLSDAVAKVIADKNLDILFEEISLRDFAESGKPKDLFKKYYNL